MVEPDHRMAEAGQQPLQEGLSAFRPHHVMGVGRMWQKRPRWRRGCKHQAPSENGCGWTLTGVVPVLAWQVSWSDKALTLGIMTPDASPHGPSRIAPVVMAEGSLLATVAGSAREQVLCKTLPDFPFNPDGNRTSVTSYWGLANRTASARAPRALLTFVKGTGALSHRPVIMCSRKCHAKRARGGSLQEITNLRAGVRLARFAHRANRKRHRYDLPDDCSAPPLLPPRSSSAPGQRVDISALVTTFPYPIYAKWADTYKKRPAPASTISPSAPAAASSQIKCQDRDLWRHRRPPESR